jgi:hypothetical protein
MACVEQFMDNYEDASDGHLEKKIRNHWAAFTGGNQP